MDFRNFFTAIFRKEWWNKSLLKVSPNLKCVDIQQRNNVIFNSKLTQNVKSQY